MIKKSKHKGRINLIKILIILLCLLFTFFIARFTYSKYQTTTNSSSQLDVAFYIVKEGYQSMSVKLDSIVPRATPYIYTFTVSNTDGTNRAQTNLSYDLSVITTTNLPLTYELLINNSDAILSNNVAQDSDGTYFRTITTNTQQFGFTADQTNTYTLKVTFPAQYTNISYQDIIEGVEIVVNSRQTIS